MEKNSGVSEELLQRYPKCKGRKIGRYELFQTQSTTINQYAKNGIIPNIDYGEFKDQKPDELFINRIPNPRVIAVGEMKKPGEVTDKNWKLLAKDLLNTKCKPMNALIGYVSDGIKTYWINGRAEDVILIQREDGDALPQNMNYDDETWQTEIDYILSYYDPVINKVKNKESKDPYLLAKEVWQTLWRLKADRPEDCLAAFVEIYIYKFLNDLGLMGGTTEDGSEISIEYLMTKEKTKTFSYYKSHVRPYIKKIFKEGNDGYGIIEGEVLQANNRDHNIIFHEILKKFMKFGSLRNTDKEFKTKLYESFLQESKTTTSFGQFFTPRKIVSAIYDMAGIEELPAGMKICDPAAGVGGFVLEQMARDLAGQWNLSGNNMEPVHTWLAYDIVPKTTMLAKANALVYCGDLLADQPGRLPSFVEWLNNTFECKDKTALGSLELMFDNEIQMIITNPPYVVSGSADISKIVNSDNKRKQYYGRKYSGVEGLFIQFIIQALSKQGDAWVLLPESFFLRTTDRELRNWILRNCKLDFMGILPERTFYNTPKRVIITHLKKRVKELDASSVIKGLKKEKTMVYTVSEIGETRDAKRFPCESNLEEMTCLYKQFKANVDIDKERAVVVSSDNLYNKKSLNVRQFYDTEIALKLGLVSSTNGSKEKHSELNSEILAIEALKLAYDTNHYLKNIPKEPTKLAVVKLSDNTLFKLRIGKRVLKKQVYKSEAVIPLYSANIRRAFGYVHTNNAGDLKYGGVLWSIDSDFDCKGVAPGEIYSITDHCGQIEILDDCIEPRFLAMEIKRVGLENGFNREYRPSLKVMSDLQIELPILEDGSYDYELMRQWADYDEEIERIQEELIKIITNSKSNEEP